MMAVVSWQRQVYKGKKWSDNTPRDKISVISFAMILYYCDCISLPWEISTEIQTWKLLVRNTSLKAFKSSMDLRLRGFTAVFIRAGLLMAYSLFIILLPCCYSNIHRVSASTVGNKLSSIDFVLVFPLGCFCKLVY